MSTYLVLNLLNSGPGSLRAAVQLANGDPGSTVDATIVGTIAITTGAIPITASMTIIGTDASSTIVNRTASTGAIFEITSSAITVNISGLTISGGINTGADGGGISSSAIGVTLNISDCIIENNTSDNGGGLYFGNGNLALTNCIFRNNSSTVGVGAGAFLDDTFVINNCTFESNVSSSSGGGLYVASTNVQIFNSTFSGNSAVEGGGIYLAVASILRVIINCTVAENVATVGGGGIYIAASQNTLINSTISNNVSPLGPGVYIAGLINPGLTIGNSVVANNFSTDTPPTLAPDFYLDFIPNTISSLGNNFIGDATGTGLAFSDPSNQTGTTISPIDPLLMTLGNYGGPTNTMLPQTTPLISPLINAGSNALVSTYFIYPELNILGSPIDQRGFERIVAGIVDIGADEAGGFICFLGNSKILTKNIITDEVAQIEAKDVIFKIHQVFDTNNKKFIPVQSNVVNGPVCKLWKIAKHSIANDKPSEDFFVTGGHKLMIDGQTIKARDIPQAKRARVASQKIYSICTEDQVPILVNGLEVMTWSKENFIKYSRERNILWEENTSSKYNVPEI